MIHATLFLGLLLLASLYAFWRGGQPEKSAAMLYVGAYVASYFAVSISRQFYSSFELGIFAVDVALAAALIALALRANRYWTLWAASIQIISVLGHMAKLIIPQILAPAYAMTLIIWSYASLPLLIAATMRHHQRKKISGRYADWQSELSTG